MCVAQLTATSLALHACTGSIVEGPVGPHGGARANNPDSEQGPGGSPSEPAFSLRCEDPKSRGRGQSHMRRLTKDELMNSMATVTGSAIMALPAMQEALALIPEESTGDLVQEFQNGHAFDHVQGVFLSAQAAAAAVVADPSARMRVFGACAAKADRACAATFLERHAQRIVRRPLSSARVEALLDAFDAEGGGNAGLQLLLGSLWQAPEAVFHLELPRESCQLEPVATFARDDADVYFSPDGGERTAPPPQVSVKGWFVWEIGKDRVPGAYRRVALDLVAVSGDEPLVIDINVNDEAVASGVMIHPGAAQVTASVDMAAGSATKVGIYFRNPGMGRALEVQSLTLEPALPDEGCPLLEASDGRVAIDDWSVASRIAYALTGQAPDDELLAAARRGELRTLAQVRPHAERLASGPLAVRQLRRFLDSWLNLRGLPTPDPIISGAADIDGAGLASEAREELLSFAAYEILERDADVTTLMSDNVGFPRSERMATLYGSELAAGDEPVSLPNGHGGLLLRVAPLLSGKIGTSPILRGVYVRKRLLCDELASPDFSIIEARTDALEEADHSHLSTREIAAEITSPGSCMSCHVSINPLGFALEEFDPLGMPRDVETVFDNAGQVVTEHPIDARVDLPNIESGGPMRLNGAAELNRALARSDKLRGCIAQRLYASGQLRAVKGADECAVSDVEQALRDGASIKDAWIVSVVNEDLFWRKAEETQ